MTRTTHGDLPPLPGCALKEDLCVVEGRELELRETNISWVFLDEQDVWKVKKPVALGFLDFSTPEKRRAACEAEVRLNRRLATDVYHGVVPVVRGVDGRHRLGNAGEAGEPVDWAVHMTRLSDAARADQRLQAGILGRVEMQGVAARLAAFHQQARCDGEIHRYGSLEVIGRNVLENFEQTRDTVRTYLSRSEAEAVEAWQSDSSRKRRGASKTGCVIAGCATAMATCASTTSTSARLDTSQPLATTVEILRRALPVWPAGYAERSTGDSRETSRRQVRGLRPQDIAAAPRSTTSRAPRTRLCFTERFTGGGKPAPRTSFNSASANPQPAPGGPTRAPERYGSRGSRDLRR